MDKVFIPASVAKAILPFASTSEHRESLRTVRIDAGRAIATDGYSMLIVRFTDHPTGAPFSVCAETLGRALVACKGDYSLEVSPTVAGPLPHAAPQDYPNWMHVIPPAGESKIDPEFPLDPELSLRVTKAFRTLAGLGRKGELRLSMIYNGARAATAGNTGAYPALALVMPYRADNPAEADKAAREALGL